MVERDGTLIAVVVSPDDFETLRRLKIERGWAARAAIDQIRARNADVDPDEGYAEITAVVEEVRQERYEERQRAATRGR